MSQERIILLKKTLLITSAVLVVLALAFIVHLARQGHISQQMSVPGLINGKLTPCPDKPNCFCSDYPDDQSHYVQPIDYAPKTAASVLAKSRTVVESMGGVVVSQNETYLAATFTSGLFTFVDDFELRIDQAQQQLYMRSASRVGYGDIGVNKRRVKQFSTELTNQLANQKSSI